MTSSGAWRECTVLACGPKLMTHLQSGSSLALRDTHPGSPISSPSTHQPRPQGRGQFTTIRAYPQALLMLADRYSVTLMRPTETDSNRQQQQHRHNRTSKAKQPRTTYYRRFAGAGGCARCRQSHRSGSLWPMAETACSRQPARVRATSSTQPGVNQHGTRDS